MLSTTDCTPTRESIVVRLLPREEEFFDLFVAVAGRNKEAARLLRELFAAPPQRRLPHIQAIKRLQHQAHQLHQEEGDAIYHDSLGRLFDKERDAVELIKWKEIYDNLELTLDQSEDVANVLESITLKHA